MEDLYLDLGYAILGVLLFRFRNPDKRFENLISVFFITLFASQLIYFYINSLTGQVVWAISSVAFLLLFFLRLKRREVTSTAMEYLRFIAVILLVLYPIPFYSVLNNVIKSELLILYYIRPITFLIAAIIFIYSRWILKPGFMKKKFVITLLSAQSILIVLLLMYAFVQKAEADAQRSTALESQMQAREAMEKAIEHRVKAEKLIDSLRNKKAD